MQWRFWRKPGLQELPVRVKNTLMSQFCLDSQSVDQMRLLGRPGHLANCQVRSIRIFDPALISGGAAARPGYHDFQLQFSGDRKALVFEGYIKEDGEVFLANRRRAITDGQPTETLTAPGR